MDHAPTLRRRHDGWTAERQAGFVAALAGGATIAAAAAAVGLSRRAAYRLRAHPAGGAVAAAWHGPPPQQDDDFDPAIDAGWAARDAAEEAAETAYRGGPNVWLRRQLRAEARRHRRRAAAARRRAEKAGRDANLCDLPPAGRGADGRFVAQNPVAVGSECDLPRLHPAPAFGAKPGRGGKRV